MRRHDLDWIRVGAFFLLILYHVGMFYVPWDWHVKSPRPVEALEPVMLLTNPWRLSLLFLVSGSATRFMADRITAGALAKMRTARLLPPLLLAVFVVVPPQTYYEIVEKLGYAGGFADFYGKYVTASGHWRPGGETLITPTYNHMWFVAYLFVYTLVLAGLLAVARAPLEALGRRLEGLGSWGLLLWPLAVLVLLRLTLFPLFPVTHAFVDDWYTHAVCLGLFLFGFLIAKSEPLKARFIAIRWPALVVALAAYAALLWLRRIPEPPLGVEIALLTVFAVDQWCAIAAAMGFGAKYLNRGGPVLTYLTLAVFPFYIVHQTIIVVVAHNLAKAELPQGLEAAIVLTATFAGCFAVYEVVGRVGWLRPWFGLKA